jgi:glycosyltransferase involved in cell wall biosynthesis
VKLAIVVPCFNEEAVLPETAQRLTALLDRLSAAGTIEAGSRIYFVDDGSTDRTWSLIESASARDARIGGVKLSRNRGHQNALLAGLATAEGDAVVSIDADLQDDVNAIAQMIDEFRAGADIVFGVRDDRRSDSWFKRWTAALFYRLMGVMGVQVVFNHADFRLMSRRALMALFEYREVNLYLRGIVPLLGYRTATVNYARAERFAGTTKYPLRRMISLAVQGVTSFSAVPLRLITGLGFAVCAGSLALTAWALWVRFFTDDALPGWTSTVVPIYFLGGVQLLCLGIIGEYLAKTYMEVKRRPRYSIERVLAPPLGETCSTSAAPANTAATGTAPTNATPASAAPANGTPANGTSANGTSANAGPDEPRRDQGKPRAQPADLER